MSKDTSSTAEDVPVSLQSASRAPISLDDLSMSRLQRGVILLTILLACLDGYDALAMAFVAPALSTAWMLGKAPLGLLLSSSFLGMAAGSLGLAPFADVVGRKPMVLGGIFIMAVGALLSAFCHSVGELAICRAVTGLGIGVMVALTTSIAAEFANLRNRPLAVALTTVGFTLGTVAGGFTAAALLKNAGWRPVFLVGAAGAAVMFIITLFSLPESPVFIVNRRAPNALNRFNRVMSRLGHSPFAALPPAPSNRRTSYKALFAPGLAGTTLRLVTVYTLVSTATYFILSWLPQLIADAGFPPSTASRVSAIASVVGIAASLMFGMLARRAGPMRVAAGAMVGLGFAIAAFGFTPPVFSLIVAAACACGFFLSGSTAVFYATMAAAFPPLSRVSGMGFVMGIGRVLSAIGPSLAGWLLAVGFSRGEVSVVFASGAVIGGLLLATSPRAPSQRETFQNQAWPSAPQI